MQTIKYSEIKDKLHSITNGLFIHYTDEIYQLEDRVTRWEDEYGPVSEDETPTIDWLEVEINEGYIYDLEFFNFIRLECFFIDNEYEDLPNRFMEKYNIRSLWFDLAALRNLIDMNLPGYLKDEENQKAVSVFDLNVAKITGVYDITAFYYAVDMDA